MVLKRIFSSRKKNQLETDTVNRNDGLRRIRTGDDVKQIFQEELDRFPENGKVEVFSYLIRPKSRDDGEDQIKYMTVPQRVVGIPAAEDEMERFTKKSYPRVHFAVDENSNTLYWQFFAQQEKQDIQYEDEFWAEPLLARELIFPNKAISLNRPLAAFVSDDERQKLFQTREVKDVANVSAEEFVELLRSNENMIVGTSHTYRINGDQKKFIYYPAEWDLIATRRSTHPNDEDYTLRYLKSNLFRGGQFYTTVHPHLDYREESWTEDPLFSEARERYGETGFLTLPTPPDAILLQQSSKEIADINRRFHNEEFSARMVGLGIVAVSDNQVRGMRFFDVAKITKDKKLDLFYDLSEQADDEMEEKPRDNWDLKPILKYFDFVNANILDEGELPYYIGD